MDDVNRREFMSLMAASLALAGVSGCSPSAKLPERIVPYVHPPEEMLPGTPLYFATAMPFGGYGIGVVVKSNEGRPTKIEGNPKHPASLGRTDVFAQAAVLDLYDPDRAKSVTRSGAIATIDSFVSAISNRFDKWQADGGAGLRFLTGTRGCKPSWRFSEPPSALTSLSGKLPRRSRRKKLMVLIAFVCARVPRKNKFALEISM